MQTTLIVVTAIVTALAAGSALAKLTRQPAVVGTMNELEVPETWFPWLAAAELAGAAGLLIGLTFVPGLGIAAGVGLCLYFAGAVVAHIRKSDYNVVPPVVIFGLAVAATALRAATI